MQIKNVLIICVKNSSWCCRHRKTGGCLQTVYLWRKQHKEWVERAGNCAGSWGGEKPNLFFDYWRMKTWWIAATVFVCTVMEPVLSQTGTDDFTHFASLHSRVTVSAEAGQPAPLVATLSRAVCPHLHTHCTKHIIQSRSTPMPLPL